MDTQALATLGWISVLPPLLTIVLALWTRRVVESLFAGVALCAYIIDAHTNGIVHLSTLTHSTLGHYPLYRPVPI